MTNIKYYGQREELKCKETEGYTVAVEALEVEIKEGCTAGTLVKDYSKGYDIYICPEFVDEFQQVGGECPEGYWKTIIYFGVDADVEIVKCTGIVSDATAGEYIPFYCSAH
jgi:hypothetical protein